MCNKRQFQQYFSYIVAVDGIVGKTEVPTNKDRFSKTHRGLNIEAIYIYIEC
jgi:hypothetical protein